ncbi:MAG TPA: arylsulfatase [Planctomycetota bacterium]|nr:arylsulfatase [Planctomycetota bacterium]
MRRLALILLLLGASPQDRRPSIVLIMTDDQGYGDLGFHGNKDIRTPHLDALGASGCRIDPFCVSPVCSPTRSSLLTGRYTYRTGIVDTFLGRSMMHADETTIAEILGQAGYRTGIFGKWHLGDNYPLRPQDQGFQDCLTIRGGGLGQSSDPPGGDHYTDATLYRNGAAFKSKGYCSDVFTDAALQFIEADKDKPFFAYVAYNAPHTPLETPAGYPLDPKLPETTAKVYAMVSNIDDNVGRLLKKLDDLKIADNTIVIFLTDNGPQQARYNAGLRGLKGTTYEGGIRVPFFFRWPAGLKVGRKVEAPFAHIDVVPTLLEATGVATPAGPKMDGISFLPWLKGDPAAPERTLFFQWHRGDVPEKFHACTARGTRWKAVWTMPTKPPELFDLEKGEQQDVSAEHPETVARLSKEYEAWYDEMKATRGFEPPRIILDPAHENPIVLTRQNCRVPTPKDAGHWLVDVPKESRFHVKVWFKAPGMKSTLTYRCGESATEIAVEPDATTASLNNVPHPPGKARISATLHAKTEYGVDYIELVPGR